ncbi:MAG TPA: response regulator [Rhodopila sp.]|nr:response regulator [Rhodopila sp.]
MKVLLIEDDQETSAYVARGLREQGHVVDLAATGRDGLFLASDGGHDVLIVDRMLPGLDGLGLVQALRSTGVKAPIRSPAFWPVSAPGW